MNSLLQRLIQIEMVMESLMCWLQEPGHGGMGKHIEQWIRSILNPQELSDFLASKGNFVK